MLITRPYAKHYREHRLTPLNNDRNNLLLTIACLYFEFFIVLRIACVAEPVLIRITSTLNLSAPLPCGIISRTAFIGTQPLNCAALLQGWQQFEVQRDFEEIQYIGPIVFPWKHTVTVYMYTECLLLRPKQSIKFEQDFFGRGWGKEVCGALPQCHVCHVMLCHRI